MFLQNADFSLPEHKVFKAMHGWQVVATSQTGHDTMFVVIFFAVYDCNDCIRLQKRPFIMRQHIFLGLF